MVHSCVMCDFLLSTAIDEASEVVGQNWKFLAGKLGFCRTDIDSIVHNHPHGLRSQIDEFFTTWRSKNKGMDPRELCAKLLTFLGAQIQGNPAVFHTFVDVLKGEPAFSALVKKLVAAYQSTPCKLIHLHVLCKCTCRLCQ